MGLTPHTASLDSIIARGPIVTDTTFLHSLCAGDHVEVHRVLAHPAWATRNPLPDSYIGRASVTDTASYKSNRRKSAGCATGIDTMVLVNHLWYSAEDGVETKNGATRIQRPTL